MKSKHHDNLETHRAVDWTEWTVVLTFAVDIGFLLSELSVASLSFTVPLSVSSVQTFFVSPDDDLQ